MKLRAGVLAVASLALLGTPALAPKAHAESSVLPVVVGVVAGAVVWPYLVPALAVEGSVATAASWQWQHALAMPAVVGGVVGGLLGYAVGH